MSQPVTRRTFWIANGVVIAATLVVGAMMTLAWVQGRANLAALHELSARLETLK